MKNFSIRFLLACVVLLAASQSVFAQTVKLAWDAPSDPSVTGYVVYYGQASGSYLASIDVGNVTQYSVANLPVGVPYYFTVKSYNASRLMSGPGGEVSTVVASDFVALSNDFRATAPPSTLPRQATQFDYDGDARADISIFRPSSGQWHILSGANQTPWGVVTFGQSGDIPMSADFDGDRKMDPAVYRPSTGKWFVLTSSSKYASIQMYTWGYPTDVATTADFDGDGRADLVIYRPSTGMWYVLRSATNYTQWFTRKWGIDLTTLPPDYSGDGTADTPVPADYDGDGLADYAVYRKSNGLWYVLYSRGGYVNYSTVKWGIDTTALPADYVGDGLPDQPVPADYDGDGKAEIAVFRNSAGYWYVLMSSTGSAQWMTVKWGMSADVPVPADYNGDGITDIAVFRPGTGDWFFYNTQTRKTWGLSTDIPIPRR
jgi:hypothetical protein